MKFLHTADWQIGKPFGSVEDPAKRTRVQQARIEAIRHIARLADEHQVAFVIVAGDLFDSSSPDRSTVSDACAAIGTISVPVYAIPGNHDHGGPGGVWEQPFFQHEQKELAPNLHLLLLPEPTELDHAILLPCPLLRRAEPLDTTAWLRASETLVTLPSGKPRLVLAHGSVQSFSSTEGDDETGIGNQLDLSRLDPEAFDYVALGDWHGAKQISPKTWYAGTPEPDRFPKGPDYAAGHTLLVEVARGEAPAVTPLPTASLRWNELTHDFSADPDGAVFRQAIEDTLGKRVGEDLLRLRLSGSIGIEFSHQLENTLNSLRARLLSLRLEDATTIAPTGDEVAELTTQSVNPLVASVAKNLLSSAALEGEEAEVARVALCALHARCRPST